MIRTAETENGIVRGIEAADPRITAFKGIPFAAPPVGENRWRAPQPCADWQGELEAYRFGPIAMQYTPGIGDNVYVKEWHVDSCIAMSEDCLQLNIWTPAMTADEKLPVYVWYFGGALQCGYPAEMEFDGERIARRKIVVVTVNYRVNVFGFLAHPEITKEAPEAPANFGHLDQQAGLKWVIKNIPAFGGDPDNITIGGQSAGGGSVMYQMACPQNKGLFKRAIVESGVIGDPYRAESVFKPLPLDEAEALGMKFFEYLGVRTLSEARKLDAAFIFKKYEQFGAMMGTVLDGKFCTGNSYSRFMNNESIHVPVLAGNTSDEFHYSIEADNEAELEKKAGELFGDAAGEFLEINEAHVSDGKGHYGSISGLEPAIKAMCLKNDMNANGSECYYYQFDADIPGGDNAGNFHSVDLWFFFETLAKSWRPFCGKHYDLSRLMCNYWAEFIKKGNPNGSDADGTEMPVWRPYTAADRCSMILTDRTVNGICGVHAEAEDSPLCRFLTDRILKK